MAALYQAHRTICMPPVVTMQVSSAHCVTMQVSSAHCITMQGFEIRKMKIGGKAQSMSGTAYLEFTDVKVGPGTE